MAHRWWLGHKCARWRTRGSRWHGGAPWVGSCPTHVDARSGWAISSIAVIHVAGPWIVGLSIRFFTTMSGMHTHGQLVFQKSVRGLENVSGCQHRNDFGLTFGLGLNRLGWCTRFFRLGCHGIERWIHLTWQLILPARIYPSTPHDVD